MLRAGLILDMARGAGVRMRNGMRNGMKNGRYIYISQGLSDLEIVYMQKQR
jgi:hypothetical protein